jgi:ABC-type transporter Mla subunit MlaD
MTDSVTLADVDESIRILTKGLMQMLAIQAQHGAALKDILTACSVPEPDGQSPLVKTLLNLITAVHDQSEAIARIEAALRRAA